MLPDAHADALRFADHWRERGYVVQGAAEMMGATMAGPDMWLVAGHVVSGSLAGIAVVCSRDCPERQWPARAEAPRATRLEDLVVVSGAMDRHALEEHDCPLASCGARAGHACLRSGGAVIDSSHRWGSYVHFARILEAQRARST